MTTRTIGEHQAEFDQWYQEWLGWKGENFQEKTPESLLYYFKLRLTVTLDPPSGAA